MSIERRTWSCPRGHVRPCWIYRSWLGRALFRLEFWWALKRGKDRDGGITVDVGCWAVSQYPDATARTEAPYRRHRMTKG